MKTLFKVLLVFVMVAVAHQGYSQSVPSAVKEAFKAKHANVTNPEWEKEGNLWEAEYRLNGREFGCLFTTTGELVGEEMEITMTELPEAVSNQVQAHHAGESITEVARFNHADGKVTYEVEVGGKDYLFDASGNPLAGEEEEEEDHDDK